MSLRRFYKETIAPVPLLFWLWFAFSVVISIGIVLLVPPLIVLVIGFVWVLFF